MKLRDSYCLSENNATETRMYSIQPIKYAIQPDKYLPVIYLFDDCLSAVDTETEEAILSNLKKASRDKTTLIVSHRVSSAIHADKIIVLDEGKILQTGTHEELLAREGYYKELYINQLSEKES